jgi:hypothetical protein
MSKAASVNGATMPNGKKYEDWIKDPGQRHTTKFEPAQWYSISDGWQVHGETTDELYLVGPGGGQRQLIFTSPSHVFDPSSPNDPTKVSAPENADKWASWFQRHPNLDTSEPVSVSVGGAAGMRIDVTLSSTLENYPRDFCGVGRPCVPLFPGIASYGKDRFVIVDVGDETVIIDVAAPADEFVDFLPKAQKVLDTVEWKSA